MSDRVEAIWRLRELMAERGLFMTSELVPLLKKHGIDLSREQVYRIATTTPQRLSLDLLGALCSILECTPNDIIQYKISRKDRKAAGDNRKSDTSLSDIKLVQTKIVRPKFDTKK